MRTQRVARDLATPNADSNKLPTGKMSPASCISAAPKNFKYEQHNGKLVNVIKNNKGGDQAIFVDCDEDDGLQFFQIGAKALSPRLS